MVAVAAVVVVVSVWCCVGRSSGVCSSLFLLGPSVCALASLEVSRWGESKRKGFSLLDVPNSVRAVWLCQWLLTGVLGFPSMPVAGGTLGPDGPRHPTHLVGGGITPSPHISVEISGGMGGFAVVDVNA